VTIPANTTGWLPLKAAQAWKYKLDGSPLAGNPHARLATQNGASGFELPSGSYAFEIEIYPALNVSSSSKGVSSAVKPTHD
jgi:hypothetical protein